MAPFLVLTYNDYAGQPRPSVRIEVHNYDTNPSFHLLDPSKRPIEVCWEQINPSQFQLYLGFNDLRGFDIDLAQSPLSPPSSVDQISLPSSQLSEGGDPEYVSGSLGNLLDIVPGESASTIHPPTPSGEQPPPLMVPTLETRNLSVAVVPTTARRVKRARKSKIRCGICDKRFRSRAAHALHVASHAVQEDST